MFVRVFIFLVINFTFCHYALAKSAELSIAYGLENYNFDLILNKFSQETGIEVSVHPFKNNDLKAELLQRSESKQLPDAVIVPSDFVGIDEIKFSQVPNSLLSDELSSHALSSMQVDGTSYGVPIIAGNHLFLMYNKTLIDKPATNWRTLLGQQKKLKPNIDLMTWSYHEMYWFIPFLGTFEELPLQNGKLNLDTKGMKNAIDWYHRLAIDGVVDSNCDYTCSINKFTQGQAAYMINGSWSYNILLNTLGDNLGVALLPQYNNKPMRPYFSSHVIAFPDNSLSGEKADELALLAHFFQRKDIQRIIWKEMRSLPTNSKVMNEISALGDDNIDTIIKQLSFSEPMPNNKEMAIIWEAMLKGINRYHAGIFTLDKTTEYMQYIAKKSIAND